MYSCITHPLAPFFVKTFYKVCENDYIEDIYLSTGKKKPPFPGQVSGPLYDNEFSSNFLPPFQTIFCLAQLIRLCHHFKVI